jgi:ribosomal protein S4E
MLDKFVYFLLVHPQIPTKKKCLPFIIFLRKGLKNALTKDEVKKICMQ